MHNELENKDALGAAVNVCWLPLRLYTHYPRSFLHALVLFYADLAKRLCWCTPNRCFKHPLLVMCLFAVLIAQQINAS